MPNESRRICRNCGKSKHEDVAQFCSVCGAALKKKITRGLYSELYIPDSKIAIDDSQEKTFLGFPFFLRKCDYNTIQVVLVKEYPAGTHTTHYLNKKEWGNKVVDIT